MVESNWFFVPEPRPGPRVRLFCFPHAGGGAAAFREWPEILPPWVEVWAVQPPGRGWRLKEQPYTTIADLVEAAADSMRVRLDYPFALFGHSMGAVVAFEIARLLEQERVNPVALFVSGRRAPGTKATDPSLEALPDGEFVKEIDRRYGGIPDVIGRDPDLLQLLLPTLRADVTALENYRHEGGSLVECPVHAFGGVQDRTVSIDELDRWREVTSSPFHRWLFPGGHFFVDDAKEQVVNRLAHELAQVLTVGETFRAVE